MKTLPSIFLGTLLSPLPMATMSFVEGVAYSRFDLITSFEIALLAYFLTLAIAAGLGLPFFWLASSLRLVRWWAAAIVGSLLGFLITVVLSGFRIMAANDLPNAFAGAAGGLMFWFVWRAGQGGCDILNKAPSTIHEG
jgi:hypothetical protein